MANVMKGVAGVATAVAWIIGMVILVMADTGRLSLWPWLTIGGAIAMFASFATLVIAFAHAVIVTSEPHESK
ncbi:membrane-bound ClpP family serine protease [Friedmanniella endophytica]|uniref:Membrane-bound ClpP family serine protease n=1 Tax=Microlunatus kandeliicorticis TaxID=1759536 RepID=A0A7W3IQU6_9ACTN|nr:hypothetical protein [Microlunatus kandeliicorticis]MBA8793525.1 membrane-bound ClpP family serine protease [Microlunatus kandeliicorticis]